jgi:DNA-binding NtrC family response regulator
LSAEASSEPRSDKGNLEVLFRAIIAARNPGLAKRLAETLERLDVRVEQSHCMEEIWSQVARESTDFIFAGREILDGDAGELVRSLRGLPEGPDVAILSDHEPPSERARFLAMGCLAVLDAQLPEEVLKGVCEAIVARRRKTQAARLSGLSSDQPKLSDFVSLSPAMQSFTEVARRVAATNTTLLILGETGVGKEWLARAIHHEGPRSSGPFLPVNCAAMPESLLESELFGHEEGAFTGASRARRGCFELAHTGTLFLDEIGDMAIHLQVKLLRVLQDRSVRRVGGETAIPIDVRVTAATNRDIRKDVAQKTFREDLYYRLSVVTLTVPPLRDRHEDIPELVDNYVNYFRNQFPHRASQVAPAALEAMIGYPWPGNVRELINVIERAMLVSPNEQIEWADLPEEIRNYGMEGANAHDQAAHAPLPLPETWLAEPLPKLLASVERSYLGRVLETAGGRVGKAAELAGIDPRVLYDKMKRYGLRKEDFRNGGERAG